MNRITVDIVSRFDHPDGVTEIYEADGVPVDHKIDALREIWEEREPGDHVHVVIFHP